MKCEEHAKLYRKCEKYAKISNSARANNAAFQPLLSLFGTSIHSNLVTAFDLLIISYYPTSVSSRRIQERDCFIFFTKVDLEKDVIGALVCLASSACGSSLC